MTATPRRGTSSGERALSLLYEAELKGSDPREVLADLPVPPDAFAVHAGRARPSDTPTRPIAASAAASVGWPLDRMAVVDRLVLRLAVSELLDPTGLPTAVVIDEAVELAKTYSTEESGRVRQRGPASWPTTRAEIRDRATSVVP